MKKIVFLLSILLSLKAAAQNDTVFSKKTPAIINNWNGRTVLFLPGYWEMAIPQLKTTLNEKLVNRIASYSNQAYYPSGLTEVLNADDNTTKNDLKIYWIATFDNNYNNQFHGKDVVLWLPKEDNKNWNTSLDWKNDIFIVIPLTDVELPPEAN